jgi:hypothetical protein
MEARAGPDPELERAQPAARLPILPVRTLQVLYAPGELFARLRERPAWIGALLLGGALVAASFLLVPVEVWERTFREQMINSGRTLPDNFQMGGAMRWFGTLGGVFSWFVLAFFLSGVLAVVFRFFLGDEGRFAQYLAVVGHALLIPAIGAMLILPLRLAQGDPQLTLNLALFVPASGDGYWLRVLRALDLFMLWGYLVMALGLSKLDRRRSWRSAAVFLLLLGVGLSMALAAFTPGL